MRKAAVLAAGPYVIPNVKVDTYGIYTNNTPSGAFRAFGALQAAFATESHLDICAERLGLDPFQIRRINAMRDGAVTHTRQKLGSREPVACARSRRKRLWLGSRRAGVARRPTRRSQSRRHPPALRAWTRVLGAKKRESDETEKLRMARKRGRGVAVMLVRHRPHPAPRRPIARRLGGDRRWRQRQG